MPFINVPLGDAKEDVVVPEGEYDIRCVKAEVKKSKAGNDMVVITCAIEDNDYPNASLATGYYTLPTSDDEPRIVNMKLRGLKRILSVLGVDFEPTGFDPEDIVGSTGKCFIGQRLSEDGQQSFHELRPPKLAE